jgi:hypothetical protein
MKKMYIGGALLLILVSFISCKKEVKIQAPPIREKDLSKFLLKSDLYFDGYIDLEKYEWELGKNLHVFGVNDNANGLCDPSYSDPNRIASSGLKAYNGDVEYLIYTPRYNMTNEKEFDRIFSVGIKDLGDIKTNFHLYIKVNNIEYRSNAYSMSDNVLEILKTKVQQVTPNIKVVQAWIKVKASLNTCNCEKTDSYLTNGYIIATFAYVHN